MATLDSHYKTEISKGILTTLKLSFKQKQTAVASLLCRNLLVHYQVTKLLQLKSFEVFFVEINPIIWKS